MKEYDGTEVLEMTVEELSTRMITGIVAWLLDGRGAEGMRGEELISALRRQVPTRWLAVFCHDTTAGLALLPHCTPNELMISTEWPGDEDLWQLPADGS